MLDNGINNVSWLIVIIIPRPYQLNRAEQMKHGYKKRDILYKQSQDNHAVIHFYKNDSDSKESTESQLCNPMYLTAAWLPRDSWWPYP